MISENIHEIRAEIARICKRNCRNPDSVMLLAVSKTFNAGLIREAFAAGISDFGENYVQELLRKKEQLSDLPIGWHFIGHLQSNKAKYLSEWISMVHSVDSFSVAQELSKRAEKAGRSIDVLIEVNTSGESSKNGVHPGEIVTFSRQLAGNRFLNVRGLMTIGRFLPNPEESRSSFRMLKEKLEEINRQKIFPESLNQLSMGMTHDFGVAIEEGATIVRIGSAIFGSRK